MQTLTGTVRDTGANARHDAALVQAALTLAQRPAQLDPARSKYLAVIDGDCGARTKSAIRLFQKDQGLVAANGAALPNAIAGLVAPGDASFTALQAAVPAELSDLRVLNGGATVYVAATGEQANANAAKVGTLTFSPTFRTLVVGLIGRIHRAHGAAIAVCRDGDGRDFQTQYALLTSGRVSPTRARVKAITTSVRVSISGLRTCGGSAPTAPW